MYLAIGKRTFDVLVALVAFLFFLPLTLLVALLVSLESPGPVFFLQERLGQGGSVFRVFKFRSMTDKSRHTVGEIHSDNDELTRVGSVIRRTKLDELPQLLNVLRGEMSLVGPRPSIVALRESFDEYGRRRLELKPGITGLAQVNGNIHLSWPERWRLDAQYVDEVSFLLDLGILFKTVAVVLLGEEKFKAT